MATARVLTLCDAIVTHITSGLASPSDATVERRYIAPIDLTAVSSRYVYVFPLANTDDAETRGEDRQVYRVQATMLERYTDSGDIPVAWADTRVDFFETYVVDRCDFLRSFLTSGTRQFVGGMVDWSIYDAEMMQQTRMLVSTATFEFFEID
jgi:hypothetical protein